MKKNKIPVGISSCLIGEAVRFDGSHCRNQLILEEFGNEFSFHPLCPELEIGLGVPRKPIELKHIGGRIHCVQSDNPEIEYTESLQKVADWVEPFHQYLCGYILKKDSPTCGMQHVKVYRNQVSEKNGIGVFAERLMQKNPLLPIEEEGRLQNKAIRENFIQRVKVLYRWKKMRALGIDPEKLMSFHARHKFLIMSRGNYSFLGKLIAQSMEHNIESIADQYILQLMRILKAIPSRKQHVNVLQHIQGFLKKYLNREDKLEMTTIIQQYGEGELPLIVPLKLFDHYFRKFPNDYIRRSYYFSAHLN